MSLALYFENSEFGISYIYIFLEEYNTIFKIVFI